MEPRTVLLIEDNEKLNEINRRALEGAGYRVCTAHTLAEARSRLAHGHPDVILLDVVLPDGDGMDFCAEIRAETDAHILFLTSRREHEDKLRGLSLGGDDYITKPFRLEELLLRVAAAMRRRSMDQASAHVLRRGRLSLDMRTGLALLEGEDMALSQKEFALLLMLVQNEGEPLSAEALYLSIWGRPMAGDKNAVQVTVSRLRKKIVPAGYDISFSRGLGYTFEKL